MCFGHCVVRRWGRGGVNNGVGLVIYVRSIYVWGGVEGWVGGVNNVVGIFIHVPSIYMWGGVRGWGGC